MWHLQRRESENFYGVALVDFQFHWGALVYYLTMASQLKSTLALICCGTLLWIVGLVIALATSATYRTIWICICGAGLGVIGAIYSYRRDRRGEL